MADFKSWATQYVVSDSQSERRELTVKAAAAIQNAPRKTTAILLWAQSIDQWIAGGGAGAFDDEDGGEDDVITRSKALEFLSGTLEVLDRDVLRVDQVETLISFFGSMFSVDHKAGIMPASKALRYLSSVKAFKPHMTVAIFKSLCSLGDDFRLQVPATRLEIYELIQRLLADDAVRGGLQQEYGPSSRFMVDFLQLCRHERDPRNLLIWFGILALFLETYAPSDDIVQEVYKTYSDYFPISMRSSTTPAGITVDDLKSAVRRCFAASNPVADSVFTFLLEKLDNGDAMTVAVKVDILKTIKACVDSYADPVKTIVPYADKIWSSLKYEVRNGEIEETIKGTLDVIRSIAQKLDGATGATIDVEPLKAFVKLVLGDCIEDLSNPIYTKQAGILLTNVLGANTRAFNLTIQPTLDAIKRNIRQPKSPSHRTDLVALLNVVLQERGNVVDSITSESSTTNLEEFQAYDLLIKELLNDVYYRLWKENVVSAPDSGQITLLKEVIKGFTGMIGQQVPTIHKEKQRLLDVESCEKIYSTTVSQIIENAGVDVDSRIIAELTPQAVLSLQKQTLVFPAGYESLLAAARLATSNPPGQYGTGSFDTAWKEPFKADLVWLKELLSRVAFIGCSEIPTQTPPITQLTLFTAFLWGLLQQFLEADANQGATIALSGIYSGFLNFRDACAKQSLIKTDASTSSAPVSLKSFSGDIPRNAETFQVGWHWLSHNNTAQEDHQRAFKSYLALALYTISLLYRKAVEINARCAERQDTFLFQLSSMAAFVVRDLTVEEQQGLKLQSRVLDLFSTKANPALFGSLETGCLDVLRLGIVQGLWPAVVTQLWHQDLSPVSLFDDLKKSDGKCLADDLTERQRFVRNCIATTIANKYVTGPGSGDENGDKWKEVIDFMRTQLAEDNLPNLTLSQYSRFLAFAAGAIARLDKGIRAVVPLLSAAPASNPAHGSDMARSIELLVSPKEYLDADNHAVVKPLYKQWVYASLAKPMIPLAFPFKQDEPQRSAAYTVAVLALLKHTPFAVYEDDVDSLARVLIAALGSSSGNSSGGGSDWRDVDAALQVLAEVLEHKPEALREHIKAVVDAARKILTEGTGPGAAAGCRRKALVLLSRLPGSYDVRHLLVYGPLMQRMLATACGDRVREVRSVAQVAREAWQRVE